VKEHRGSSSDGFSRKVYRFYTKYYDRGKEIPFSYLAWSENGSIKTVFLFDDYLYYSLQLHCASIQPLTRNMLRAIYEYAFIQQRCEVLQVRTPNDNEHTIKVLKKAGFITLGVVPKCFGPHQDAVLFYITKEKAKKWYK
jgi:hypothetical protein